jgi:hypothetical protein
LEGSKLSTPFLTEEEKMKKYIDEKLSRIKDDKITSAWYNPTKSLHKDKDNTGNTLEPETIYVGEVGGRPTWENPVMHVPSYHEAKKLYKEGKINSEEFVTRFAKAIKPEWEGRMVEAYYGMKQRSAGTITSNDFSAINVVNVLSELLGTQWRVHTLEQAVWVVPTPSLHLDIDTYVKFTAQQDVPEGAYSPTAKGNFSRQSMDLGKDVANLAFTDEVLMRPYDHNIYQSHVQNAVQDLKRIKAKKIATELETATDVSGADWGAFSGGYSSNKPLDDIGGVVDTVEANDGTVDVITTADRAYRDFISNTWVKGNMGVTPGTAFGPRVIDSIQGLNGFTWYIDQELTNTIATVYDRNAIILAQGPVRTAQYRDELHGVDGYITRDWNAVKIVNSGWIRNITGISA